MQRRRHCVDLCALPLLMLDQYRGAILGTRSLRLGGVTLGGEVSSLHPGIDGDAKKPSN